MYNQKQLAEIIMQLNYGDLLQVATELFDMNAGENKGLRDMESPYGMAGTLYDWAEATAEECREREIKRIKAVS